MVVLCLCTVQIPSWVRTLTYEASIHINAILNVHIFPYISLWRSNIYSLFSNIYLKILCTNSVFKISMNKKEHMLWIYGPKKIPHENDEWNRKFYAEKTHSPEYTHIVIAWVECSAYCVSKKKMFSILYAFKPHCITAETSKCWRMKMLDCFDTNAINFFTAARTHHITICIDRPTCLSARIIYNIHPIHWVKWDKRKPWCWCVQSLPPARDLIKLNATHIHFRLCVSFFGARIMMLKHKNEYER